METEQPAGGVVAFVDGVFSVVRPMDAAIPGTQVETRLTLLIPLPDDDFADDGRNNGGRTAVLSPAGMTKPIMAGVHVRVEMDAVLLPLVTLASAPTGLRRPSAKLTAIAEAMRRRSGAAFDDPGMRLLWSALARTASRALVPAAFRRDDAWLHPDAMLRVADHVGLHLDGPLPVADLARVVGVGSSAFRRAFRGTAGVTPGAYVRSRRLDLAQYLLRTSGMPVAEVAAASGFASSAHFATAVRGFTGLAPRRYRDAHRKQRRDADAGAAPRRDCDRSNPALASKGP